MIKDTTSSDCQTSNGWNGTDGIRFPYTIQPYNDVWEEEEITTIVKKTKDGETEETTTITKRKRKVNPYTPPTYTPFVPWCSQTITITAKEQPCMFDSVDWSKTSVVGISCPCPKHTIMC